MVLIVCYGYLLPSSYRFVLWRHSGCRLFLRKPQNHTLYVVPGFLHQPNRWMSTGCLKLWDKHHELQKLVPWDSYFHTEDSIPLCAAQEQPPPPDGTCMHWCRYGGWQHSEEKQFLIYIAANLLFEFRSHTLTQTPTFPTNRDCSTFCLKEQRCQDSEASCQFCSDSVFAYFSSIRFPLLL